MVAATSRHRLRFLLLLLPPLWLVLCLDSEGHFYVYNFICLHFLIF